MAWQDRAYHRESDFGGPRFVFPMPSRLTFGLIIACVIVFFLERLTGPFGHSLGYYGMLTFADGLAFKQPWRWVTYQYMHAGGMHLFFNLIVIYFFVPALERLWGWRRTLAFYTVGGIVAGATFGLMNLFGVALGLVGASGSLFAVMGALTALMPNMQILAMMVIPITMRTLTLLYTVLFILTVVGDRSFSDAAHLGGLAFGFLVVQFGWRLWSGLMWMKLGPSEQGYRAAPRRRSRRAARRALKLAEADRREQERIDQILAKVSTYGMQSLTWSERRALRKATEHQRERDAELTRMRRD